MTKKHIDRNIQRFKNERDINRNKIPAQTLRKVNTIIDFYEDRKIVQFGTANNLIKGITATNDKELKKGLKQYEKAVAKYQNIAPIGERMKPATEKANRGKTLAKIRRRINEKTPLRRIQRMYRDNITKDRETIVIKYILYTSDEGRATKSGLFRLNGF